ncbi:phosphoenolpyruvate synthase [Candidatus Beckwithbacteria bacterium RBG_13_42_9]|uniref:Phosphoenolpyruvate synthase n=1 Tax=Candidatus Beckwithbacteria bacterium RBG_13_42_9 TaxID=1797457 RepID=A0A1F5E5F1_9BACT|nr:MAG: phosphoenolpyruvate synthase [Candidatus Beckwithbacteria bacterium RBG_13_42_9]
MVTAPNKFVLQFSQINKDDIPLVGGKGANLGEMVKAGFPVPPGFVVTAQAYYYFLEKNHLKDLITKELYLLDTQDPENLQRITTRIRQIIISAPVPKDLAKGVFKAYELLDGKLKNALVAVRSSATAEDLPGASFAGQQETYLNIKGEASVVEHIRLAWASLFTPRATFYRAEKGFDHFKVGIAVPVQKMIQSEASGVMFTLDPVKNDKTKIIIEAIFGLGEFIVQGAVTPDHYEVSKDTLKITEKQINSQLVKLAKEGLNTKQIKIAEPKQKSQKLQDNYIVELAEIGKKIHQHYFFPQDIEWALEKGKLYILQTRPVTTLSQKSKVKSQKEEEGLVRLPQLVTGKGASPGLVSGKARIIFSAQEISQIEAGEILVTKMTTPDFVPAMRKVVAIVTNEGGLTSHAAIVSRELGVTCVVGTQEATSKIKNGQMITVDGARGIIYDGQMELNSKFLGINSRSLPKAETSQILGPKQKLKKIKTATKVYVNLAEPDLAKKVAQKDVDGVGLLRAEFMIAQIGIHPKRLIAEGKREVFINKLAKGLETFAKAFSPRPVIYRATDFKTNEYQHLVGGKDYEPDESNPMLGFRGAWRYLIQPEVFELELEAIKLVRNKLGFRNLQLMIPFVRTVKELIEVKKIIAVNGLMRLPSFKLFMMVEIPSNVILLPQFIEAGIDGISIGSNDLTMLTLGLDRDNEEVASLFDEQNEAVLWLLRRAIRIANKYKISSSICGQAPSEYPTLTESLVKWGITSVSVSPDALEQTRAIVHEAERKLVLGR